MIEMGVEVGGRLFQIRPKNVLWVSNPVILRAMAIHECCSELGNPMIPLLHGAGIVLLKHLSVSVNSIGHMWLQNIVYYCPHHYASTANHINFMYADRNETLISKLGYADFSITSL
jgi:hypothetical protein